MTDNSSWQNNTDIEQWWNALVTSRALISFFPLTIITYIFCYCYYGFCFFFYFSRGRTNKPHRRWMRFCCMTRTRHPSAYSWYDKSFAAKRSAIRGWAHFFSYFISRISSTVSLVGYEQRVVENRVTFARLSHFVCDSITWFILSEAENKFCGRLSLFINIVRIISVHWEVLLIVVKQIKTFCTIITSERTF